MGKRPKKMASGGKPNLEAMGEKVTPPVNVKRENEKQLRKKRYKVEKDMPAKKLADMADRARRRATGSQAVMQEMGSATEPRTAKSKLKRRFGADTSKEDYGRKASGGSVKKKTPKANIGGAAAGAAAGVNKLKKPRAGIGKIREYKLTEIATGGSVKKMAKSGFPDLNKDGKVTKKDVLIGRGVKMAKSGISRETLNKSIGQAMEHIKKNKKKFDGKVVKKMAEGGMAPPKGLNRILEKVAKDKKKFDGRIVKSKKKMPTRAMLEKMPKKMATGGKVKGRRGDGICSRGRTKGRIV
jgi:hypothetical protein